MHTCGECANPFIDLLELVSLSHKPSDSNLGNAGILYRPDFATELRIQDLYKIWSPQITRHFRLDQAIWPQGKSKEDHAHLLVRITPEGDPKAALWLRLERRLKSVSTNERNSRLASFKPRARPRFTADDVVSISLSVGPLGCEDLSAVENIQTSMGFPPNWRITLAYLLNALDIIQEVSHSKFYDAMASRFFVTVTLEVLASTGGAIRGYGGWTDRSVLVTKQEQANQYTLIMQRVAKLNTENRADMGNS
ncbi:hypothetical protein FRC12_002962 [Ceratobasidium sp. 428]|nr:hypothetical protein FRC12_002962 [Ceratobasidium sp. 428]